MAARFPRRSVHALVAALAAATSVATATSVAAAPAGDTGRAPVPVPPPVPAAAAATPLPAAAASSAAPELAAAADGGLDLRDRGVVVAHIPVKTPLLRRGSPRIQVVAIGSHRVADVRIPVRGRPAEEVWVGEIGVRPARPIWSGFTGPRDADEEVSLALEVSESGVLEYQTAAQIGRCDGEPTRLFPRAWDFASGRLRPIVSTVPAPASQTLTARRGDPAMPSGRPIGGFRFTAASTTAAAGADARALAAPTALDDGDPRTTWAEGLGGDGRGEFLTARSSAGRYRVRGLRLIPGDASSPAAFKARNRVKALALALGPEPERRFEIELLEDPAAAGEGQVRVPYWVPLPVPVETSCLTLVIREVYRGAEAAQQRVPGAGGTTAISDLEVFTELDDATGVERLVSDAAAGPDCGSRVPLLVDLGERAVLPASQGILGASGVGRECLVEALVGIDDTFKSAVALDALAAALAGSSAKEERLILAALRKTAAPPVRAIADLLVAPKAEPDDRARAARALGELTTPEATAALLAAAGTGPPPVRLAVVQAVGRSPGAAVPEVVTALDHARSGIGRRPADPPDPEDAVRRVSRAADLLRTLPPLVRRSPDDRAAAVEAARRWLPSTYPFEIRARAVMALGSLGDPAVAVDLRALQASSDDPVLRFFATRELAEVGGPDAVAALRGALSDADPRVRETAALGLGHHRDRASETELIKGAKQEPWPFVRRAELEALARLCGTAGRDLMIRAHHRDVDEVKRAALAGLVRCRDPRARPVLFQTLKGRRAGAPLRELAAALIGELGQHGDRAAAAELAATVPALVNEAEGDLAIEGVTVSALRALGHLGGAEAAAVAARLAADRRHPYRHTAVEVLGQLCDPGAGARALAAVRTGSDPQLAFAAQNAEQRCKSRGAAR
jgi:HEAT repeat protein